MPDEKNDSSPPEPQTTAKETAELSETRKGVQVMPAVQIDPADAPPSAVLPDAQGPVSPTSDPTSTPASADDGSVAPESEE
jgi:hypothetical protein